ncbi:hypothetical protein DBR28_05535, partial [Chryseobacterium sp. HMWF028]
LESTSIIRWILFFKITVTAIEEGEYIFAKISKKMRIIIFISILFTVFVSGQKSSSYSILKKELLYKDKESNIYLQCKMDIASEKNPRDNKTVYLDDVLYKSKVLKLKQLIDVSTFHKIATHDKKDAFVEGIYEDKKYKYIFRDHPSSSPNIQAFDK